MKNICHEEHNMKIICHEEHTLRQIYDNLRHYGTIDWDKEYTFKHAFRITQFNFENEKIVVFMKDGNIIFIDNLTKKEEFRNIENRC